MAQRNDNGVLPNSVITRENSIQSSISTISLQVEENVEAQVRDTSTRASSILSSISNEVVNEVRVVIKAGSNRRKIVNKVDPGIVSSPTISNESEEGRINIQQIESLGK